MATSIPIRRIWSWLIALYKLLWHPRPTLDPKVFTSIFRRFVVLLKIVRITWYGKQTYSKPPSSNQGTTSSNEVRSRDQESEHLKEVDQTVVPLQNISCSLYPYGTGLHNPSRSSQMINASRSSHNLAISQTRYVSRSSHNVGSSDAHSPLGGRYTFTIRPTSSRRYSMSSPELMRPHVTDLPDAITQRRPRIPQIFSQPRSDSPVGSVKLLSPGGISSSRDHVLPATESPIEQSIELPFLEAVGTSSQAHTDDLEIPALNHHRIYPTVPEFFQRYEKRRTM